MFHGRFNYGMFGKTCSSVYPLWFLLTNINTKKYSYRFGLCPMIISLFNGQIVNFKSESAVSFGVIH